MENLSISFLSLSPGGCVRVSNLLCKRHWTGGSYIHRVTPCCTQPNLHPPCFSFFTLLLFLAFSPSHLATFGLLTFWCLCRSNRESVEEERAYRYCGLCLGVYVYAYVIWTIFFFVCILSEYYMSEICLYTVIWTLWSFAKCVLYVESLYLSIC